jgi:hypothetical protein
MVAVHMQKTFTGTLLVAAVLGTPAAVHSTTPVMLPLSRATVIPCARTPGNPVLAAPQDTPQMRPNASLKVVGDSSERRVAIFRNGRESGSVALPTRVSAAAVAEGLEKALWHPNRDDVAVAFKGVERMIPDKLGARDRGPVSFVVVFLLQPGGTYNVVDVSLVELVNIGRIGPFRSYRNAETTPTRWVHRESDDVQVWLHTAAWDLTGQRYRSSEPLIITRDGRPLWR